MNTELVLRKQSNISQLWSSATLLSPSASENTLSSNGSTTVPFKVDSYKFFQKIGEGAYCKVRLVQFKGTKEYYALKYTPKFQSGSRLKTISQERNILANLRHPLVCNLQYAFQDSRFLYMVLELMAGGDLRYHLQRVALSEPRIRVIVAEIAGAVDYLHSHGIVHRNIKPENILFDSNGHAHLGDFNVAVQVPNNSCICGVSGTFSYLAPEMHQQVAYNGQVDWWALGVVFYECVYGELPFRSRSREKMMKLMSRGATYPATSPTVSNECIAAIKMFLVFNSTGRVSNADTMLNLEFFKGMERKFLELEDMPADSELKPIFKPQRCLISSAQKCDRKMAFNKDIKGWKKKVKNKRTKKEQKHARKKQIVESKRKSRYLDYIGKLFGNRSPNSAFQVNIDNGDFVTFNYQDTETKVDEYHCSHSVTVTM